MYDYRYTSPIVMNKTRHETLRQGVILGAALIYALVLANLPLMVFMDRANYLNYSTYAGEIFGRYYERGVIALFVNEPLWLLVNIALRLMLSPEGVVKAIIFSSAFIFSYAFLRADPKNIFWLVLFLLLPQVLKNYITHLRQGLAISVFLSGYMSQKRMIRGICIMVAPFIHVSFFFILLLVFFEHIGKRLRFAIDVRSLNGLILAVLLGIGTLNIASWLGARQGYEYSLGTQMETGLGFVFWSCMLILMILQGKRYLDRYSLPVLGILFYLGMYFLSPVAARVFESILPLVLLAVLALNGWRKLAAQWSLLAYFIFQWVFGFMRGGPMF